MSDADTLVALLVLPLAGAGGFVAGQLVSHYLNRWRRR
jgi:hypothetical protein